MNAAHPDQRISLDLGLQPASNCFPQFATDKVDRFPLRIVWDPDKLLAKIASPFPRHAIRPVHPWLSYREPEEHLDEVAQVIHSQLSPHGTAIALTYKDESLLVRLENLGLRADRIDAQRDLKIAHKTFGLESIDEAISSDQLERGAEEPAVFLARHILEHTVFPQTFLKGIMHSMKDGDLIFIETPECTDALKRHDYTLIWEEHNFYYTERSLKREIEQAGLEVIWQKTHPYPMEGSALFLAKKGQAKTGYKSASEPPINDEALFRSYAERFAPTKSAWRSKLQELTARKERIALFGAGHFACAFVHYLETAPFVSHCIDDHRQKQGKHLPGTQLPIAANSILLGENPPEICLLTVNPDSEAKILEKLAPFLERGGKAFSIFPNSPRYLLK